MRFYPLPDIKEFTCSTPKKRNTWRANTIASNPLPRGCCFSIETENPCSLDIYLRLFVGCMDDTPGLGVVISILGIHIFQTLSVFRSV
jgi:hypothetical protein